MTNLTFHEVMAQPDRLFDYLVQTAVDVVSEEQTTRDLNDKMEQLAHKIFSDEIKKAIRKCRVSRARTRRMCALRIFLKKMKVETDPIAKDLLRKNFIKLLYRFYTITPIELIEKCIVKVGKSAERSLTHNNRKIVHLKNQCKFLEEQKQFLIQQEKERVRFIYMHTLGHGGAFRSAIAPQDARYDIELDYINRINPIEFEIFKAQQKEDISRIEQLEAQKRELFKERNEALAKIMH